MPRCFVPHGGFVSGCTALYMVAPQCTARREAMARRERSTVFLFNHFDIRLLRRLIMITWYLYSLQLYRRKFRVLRLLAAGHVERPSCGTDIYTQAFHSISIPRLVCTHPSLAMWKNRTPRSTDQLQVDIDTSGQMNS